MKAAIRKRVSIVLYTVALLLPYTGSAASEIFDAPLPDGGELISAGKTGMVTVRYDNLSPAEIADFYNRHLTGMSDIKWNETEGSREVVIYDWGNRPWHRINVYSSGTGKETLLTIRKDSWTWIIGTLIIRFVGVFVVLFILMIALLVSGSIFSFKKTQTENKTDGMAIDRKK